MICVSIVSHGHIDMTASLVRDIRKFSEVSQIIVTLNLKGEDESLLLNQGVTIVHNAVQKGFSENHNNAFGLCDEDYFCILNPDITFFENPFRDLLACLKNESLAMVAPAVVSVEGSLEDNVRHFPTIGNLVMKLVGLDTSRIVDMSTDCVPIPWAAGMFLLVKSKAFASVEGFDQGYYLYYEDVDLCARLWLSGWRVGHLRTAVVVHDARRDSRKHLNFFFMHFISLCRYMYRYRLGVSVPRVI